MSAKKERGPAASGADPAAAPPSEAVSQSATEAADTPAEVAETPAEVAARAAEASHEEAPPEEGTEEEAAQVLAADLAALESERDELRAMAQRIQADFENYRKRVLREQTALAERASQALVGQLLPVLDNFELALANLGGVDANIRKGVELVYADFLGVLEKVGLERIDTDGKPFDPALHEAVLDEGGEGEPVVAETMRAGYRLKGTVLRPAMVKVTRRAR